MDAHAIEPATMDPATAFADETGAITVGPHLRPRYRTVHLVSHARHLAEVDADALVASSDWLVWREAVTRGLHALHLDAGSMADAEANAQRADLFAIADSWVYDGADDVTRFRGVSLGKLFTRETSLLVQSVHKLATEIDWFCAAFRPQKLVLSDIRTEYGLVDAVLKRHIAANAAQRHGVAFEDRLDDVGPESGAYPFLSDFTLRPQTTGTAWSGREILRYLYSRAIDAVSTVAWILHGRKPAVLLLPTGLMMPAILAAHDGDRRVVPMLIAERERKSSDFIAAMLGRGGRLVHMPRVRLSRDDKSNIARMRERVAAMAEPDDALRAALAHHVRANVMHHGVLEAAALQVKRIETLLRTRRPARIVVSEHMNPGSREYIELGARLGIPVDYLPHGMRTSRTRHETMTGLDGAKPLVARFLAWGDQMLHYLGDYPGSCAGLRIGYPAIVEIRRRIAATNAPREAHRHALILPYSPDTEGFLDTPSRIYPLLLGLIRELHARGYAIRVKIHPGAKFNRTYFERVLALADAPVELVHGDVGLAPHLAWADIVVGPVASGSTVETLAARKILFPLLIAPSVNTRRYLRGVPLFGSAAEVAAALDEGYTPDYDALLQYFCSTADRPDPGRAFWQSMETALA